MCLWDTLRKTVKAVYKSIAYNCFSFIDIQILFLPDYKSSSNRRLPTVLHANIHTMRIIQSEEWKTYPFAYNGCFGVSCNKKLIIGGGSYSDGQSTMKAFEESDSSSHNFKPIMPLNYGRTGASACYSPWHRKVIVAGGTSTYLDDYTLYDLRNVELMDTRPRIPGSCSLSTNKWIACKDKIPGIFGANVEVFALYDKIILVDIEYNKVYEGQILPEETNNVQRQRNSDCHLTEFELRGQVNWNKAVIPQVNILWSAFPEIEKRYNHSIVVLGNRLLLCIGGHYTFNNRCARICEYFSCETNSWNMGPELPFCLEQAQILPLDDEEDNDSLRCLIVGGKRNHSVCPVLSIFDLGKGTIDNFKGTLNRSVALKCNNTKNLSDGPNRNLAIIL